MKKLIVIAFFALALASAAEGAVKSITPTPWNGDPNCGQMRRHNGKLKEIAEKGGAKVVFIGDSITHFWETTGKEQLAKYFSEGDYRMLDLGTSGDTTENVLWRLDNGELDGYEAKVVVLMIGTNNTGHRQFSEEPPIDTILGVKAVIGKIRAKQPNAAVVLLPIFPRGAGAMDDRRRRNDVVNKEIAKYADGKTIFWCDFTDQFLTVDGDLSPEIFPDRLHPNALGYEIWAAAVMPYIDWALSSGKLPRPMNRYASRVRTGAMRQREKATIYPVTRLNEQMGKRPRDWWGERLEEKRTQISESNGEIDLVFLGDSITHFWESNGTNYLRRLRETYSVLDLGYSGDKVENLLWRLRNGELEGYKAKAFMLMIGTNNGKDSPADIAEGIKAVLDIIASKHPESKTYLLPIFPRGERADDKNRLRNHEVNALIAKFADGEKVEIVDVGAKLVDENGDTRPFMADRLHPNPGGYHIWMDTMLPYFRKTCGK